MHKSQHQFTSPDLNFTNILRAAFTHIDPKKDSQLKQLFAFLGSAGVKAAQKHVDEIDPRSQPSIKKYESSSKKTLKIQEFISFFIREFCCWHTRKNHVYKKIEPITFWRPLRKRPCKRPIRLSVMTSTNWSNPNQETKYELHSC